MALNIKDPEADRVVRELAEVTGESITAAITVAARERLDRVRGVAPAQERARRIRALADEFSKRPVLDDRSPDEILGYDEHGLPS
jgi:antitoxin VapB